jgi:hypothetical protein
MACKQGRMVSDAWPVPGEDGPAREEGKWASLGRIVPSSIYLNISKRLELIQSKCVLPNF